MRGDEREIEKEGEEGLPISNFPGEIIPILMLSLPKSIPMTLA